MKKNLVTILGIVACLIAVGAGLFVRQKMNNTHESTPEPVVDETIEPYTTDDPEEEATPSPYEATQRGYGYQRFYTLRPYEIWEGDENVNSQPATMSDGTDPTFPDSDWAPYVYQNDRMISNGILDELVDCRKNTNTIQIHDYYLAYSGPTTVVGNKVIPYPDGEIGTDPLVDYGVHYIQLEAPSGVSVEHLDEINEQLRSTALENFERHVNKNEIDLEAFNGASESYPSLAADATRIETYVTYQNDQVLGVAISLYDTDYFECTLKSFTINLQDGTLYTPEEMLGSVEYLTTLVESAAQEQFPDSEVLNQLGPSEVAGIIIYGDQGIVQFTPEGLELGLNYENEYGIGSVGWLTMDIPFELFPSLESMAIIHQEDYAQ